MNDLIDRLRSEAEISDRPGQYDRLNELADEFAAKIAALQSLCAQVYQAAGAFGMPERVLDVLSDAANGDPIRHANILPVDPPAYEARIAKLEVENARLRSERDALQEALKDMLQLLEALGRAHQTAMEQTLKARIPECAEFAGIAQDLDFAVATLRERLGEKV